MLVLGIETTCDETGVAIVRDGKEILINLVNSQIDLHEKYLGVFPEYASRRHLEALIPLIDEALQQTGLSKHDIDLIAVAYGPGLIGALVIGLNAAKALSLAWNKPLIGINHVEAHLYAAVMCADIPPPLPALGVAISGGHTVLFHLDHTVTSLIGCTVDDAIGEAFDKVAVLLGLSYPGGPAIERLAQQGNPFAYTFKAGSVKKNVFDFSFSGLKTQIFYLKTYDDKADIAASFQHVALMDIVKKTLLAAKTFGCKSILFGGGVSINRYLRYLIDANNTDAIPIFWPSNTLCLDNAAMIAGLGCKKFLINGSDDMLLEAKPRIPYAEYGKYIIMNA
jgi:N6-L-threonylcarbamoyladenine synthase